MSLNAFKPNKQISDGIYCTIVVLMTGRRNSHMHSGCMNCACVWTDGENPAGFFYRASALPCYAALSVLSMDVCLSVRRHAVFCQNDAN